MQIEHQEYLALAYCLESKQYRDSSGLQPSMFVGSNTRELAYLIWRGYTTWDSTQGATKEAWLPLLTARNTSSLDHRVEYGVKKVLRRAAKAEWMRQTAEKMRRAQDDRDDCEDIIPIPGDLRAIGAAEMAEVAHRHYSKQKSFKTRLNPVSKMLGYMGPGDVYLICGKSSTGKTNLLFQATEQLNVAYFGADMTTAAVAKRWWEIDFYRRNLGARESMAELRQACYRDFLQAALSPQEIEATIPKGFRTFDGGTISIEGVRFAVDDLLRSGFLPDVIALDYLGRITTERKGVDQEWRLDKYLANCLKETAKALKIPIICLVQFNKSAKDFERPEESWLQGSSDLKPTVDGIISLWLEKKKAESGYVADETFLWCSDHMKSRDMGGCGDHKIYRHGLYLHEQGPDETIGGLDW